MSLGKRPVPDDWDGDVQCRHCGMNTWEWNGIQHLKVRKICAGMN